MDTRRLPTAVLLAVVGLLVLGTWVAHGDPLGGNKVVVTDTAGNAVDTTLVSSKRALKVDVVQSVASGGGSSVVAIDGGYVVIYGAAKGATTSAGLTSTAEGADHQGVDVQLYSGGAAINPQTIRALTSADVVTCAQGTAASLNATAVGTKTNNNATPGATNFGALVGVANAAAPTYTEADEVLLSTDLAGSLRVATVGTTTVGGTVTTTPPANASTNIAQFGGNAVATGTGAGGVGIPRVTVSNDSSLLGTKTNNNAAPGATNFGVLPAIATAAAQSWTEGNQVGLSCDLAGALRSDMTKVAGSATATATTGVQLVGIEGRAGTSMESTAGVLDLNIKNVGNSAATTAATGKLAVGVTGNAGAAFDSATGTAPPANALFVGYRESTNLVGAIQCDKTAQTSVTTATTTSLVAVSGSTTVYVCGYTIEVIGVATTAGSAQLEYGTGAACTSPTVVTPAYLGTLDGTNKSATVITQQAGNGYLFKTAASAGLCVLTAADANTIKVFITYAQF